MKKEDFQRWLQEDLDDKESNIFEKNIMENLLEHRLQQEFKERLQNRRVRRNHFLWGLIALLILMLIGVLVYVFSRKNNTDLSYQPPAMPSEYIQEATISAEIKVKVPDNLQNNTEKPQKTVIDLPQVPSDIKHEHSIAENKQNLIENPPLKTFSPPKDTEYIYLKSNSEPILYPKNSGNSDTQDPYSDVITKDFSKQKLTQIPPSVWLYKRLRTLIVADNQLANLPADIYQLQMLEVLTVRNNKITQLPIEIAQLKNLKILDVSRNRLKELPDAVKNLQRLEELNISHNRLSSIPFDFEELRNLKTFNLKNNLLDIFPLCLERMTQLTHLDLSQNKMSDLPEGIGNLTNLIHLDLSFNKLRNLPDALYELNKLKFLKLSGNDIPASEVQELEKALPDCKIVLY